MKPLDSNWKRKLKDWSLRSNGGGLWLEDDVQLEMKGRRTSLNHCKRFLVDLDYRAAAAAAVLVDTDASV